MIMIDWFQEVGLGKFYFDIRYSQLPFEGLSTLYSILPSAYHTPSWREPLVRIVLVGEIDGSYLGVGL